MKARQSIVPVKRDLRFMLLLSVWIALLMAAASAAGLIYRTILYPTQALVENFLPNDVVNLVIGVPMLLGSLWFVWRGKLLGYLIWPGALIFVLYTYLAYVFAAPLTWAYLLYLALAMLSLYTLVGVVTALDGAVLQQKLTGKVVEKFSGSVLAGLGLLFLVRVVVVIAGALASGTPVPDTDLAVSISDFFISPAMVIGGILLWQRKTIGYLVGLGLLFQASMLFIALIAFLLLQPVFTTAPFALVDVIVVFAMGLVCFIPFGLFVKGVVKQG